MIDQSINQSIILHHRMANTLLCDLKLYSVYGLEHILV